MSEGAVTFDWGDRLPRLAGRRGDLRWLTQLDAPAILAIFGDPEVMRFWSSPPLPDLAAATELIEDVHELFRSRRVFEWGFGAKDTDEIVGTCTLAHFEPTHRRAEVGFALARSAWGQGYATEALELLIDFAFETLELHRLEADVDPRNDRALRLLEHQGFKREGYLRERWHQPETQDAVFLGLLRREWTPRIRPIPPP